MKNIDLYQIVFCEDFAGYNFSVVETSQGNYCYRVFSDKNMIQKSEEFFEDASEAKLAAIGYISLLEKGEIA